ncbi:MAG: hypothetical protein GTO54_11735 [Nitrososphaeria archaeon]|nr:hypothetical protein [Nitrososphaeria archaeon]
MLLEWKLRPLLSHYRGLVNTLIEFIDRMAYQEKEKFLDGLPQVLKTAEELNTCEE